MDFGQHSYGCARAVSMTTFMTASAKSSGSSGLVHALSVSRVHHVATRTAEADQWLKQRSTPLRRSRITASRSRSKKPYGAHRRFEGARHAAQKLPLRPHRSPGQDVIRYPKAAVGQRTRYQIRMCRGHDGRQRSKSKRYHSQPSITVTAARHPIRLKL